MLAALDFGSFLVGLVIGGFCAIVAAIWSIVNEVNKKR